jgi:hypothetical protein
MVDEPRCRRGADELAGGTRVADQLPHDDPVRMSMRIAPRSFLCATAFVDGSGSKTGFDELRELCAAADDERSLAVGMAGLVMEKFVKGRYREASRLASEHTQLLESIGDPVLTVALSFAAIAAKFQASDIAEVHGWRSASSTWPMAIQRKAISSSDRHWPPRSLFVGLPDARLENQAGKATSAKV